jgi:hypothetical protein
MRSAWLHGGPLRGRPRRTALPFFRGQDRSRERGRRPVVRRVTFHLCKGFLTFVPRAGLSGSKTSTGVIEGCTYCDRGPDQWFPSGRSAGPNPETVPLMADGSLLRSGGESWAPASPDNVRETGVSAGGQLGIPRSRRARQVERTRRKTWSRGPIRGLWPTRVLVPRRTPTRPRSHHRNSDHAATCPFTNRSSCRCRTVHAAGSSARRPHSTFAVLGLKYSNSWIG